MDQPSTAPTNAPDPVVAAPAQTPPYAWPSQNPAWPLPENTTNPAPVWSLMPPQRSMPGNAPHAWSQPLPPQPHAWPQPQSPAPAPAPAAKPGFSFNFQALVPYILIAVLAYMYFSKPGNNVEPAPAPSPEPVVQIVASIKAILGDDKNAAAFYGVLSSRIAEVLEEDGKAPAPRVTSKEQVAEVFIQDVGRFSHLPGDKRYPGLADLLLAQFKMEETVGKLEASDRAAVVTKWRLLSDAFNRAAK